MSTDDVNERTDPPTDWENVQQASCPSTAQGSEALGQLLERYRPWMLAHLAARFHFKDHELQDVLHDFIELKILRNGILSRTDPKRGSFQAFLREALDNFAVSEIRRRKAKKRAPADQHENIETTSHPNLQVDPAPPDTSHELVWAQAIIAGALLDMRNELVRTNRLDIWEVFKGRVLQTMLNDDLPLDYSTIISRFKYETPSKALNILVTAKRMFRRHLRTVIAQYIHSDSEIEEELARLKWILER